MKKITLKEISSHAKEYAQKMPEYMGKISFDVPNDIVETNYTKDGIRYEICHCPVCGATWNSENKTYVCPSCGNHSNVVVMYPYRTASKAVTHSRNTYVKVLEMDQTAGYVLLCSVTPAFTYEQDMPLANPVFEQADFSYMAGQWEKSFENSHYYFTVFLKDKGFRHLQSDGTAERCYYCNGYWGKTLDKMILTNEDSVKLCEFACTVTNTAACTKKNVFDVLSDYSDNINRNIQARKKTSVTKQDAELLAYNPESLSKKEITDAEIDIGFSMAVTKDSFANMSRYLVYCGNCGETFTTEDVTYGFRDAECPHCGMQTHARALGGIDFFEAVKFSVMPGTNVLVEHCYHISEHLSATGEHTATATEQKRIYFADKKELYFDQTDNGWKKKAVPAYERGKRALVQSKETIISLIKSSNMKYAGLEVAWGLTENAGLDSPGEYDRNSYAYKWYDSPCIEKLVKIGLRCATQDIIRGIGTVYNKNGSNVTEILNINKPVLRMAREKNLNIFEISQLKTLYDLDQTITAEGFKKLTDICPTSQIVKMSETYHISLKKIGEYLQSCLDHQCIRPREAISTWFDYLHMADELGYDLTDKSRKFPQSLKKEHDIASFAYDKVKDEISQKRFAKQYEYNKKYEYAKGKLMVRIPQKAEEIVSEAKSQHNCVASYVNRVCDGDTIVAFVRYKDKPDESYVTMEILDGRIFQLKGFANKTVCDRETLQFVREFAGKKGLTCRF